MTEYWVSVLVWVVSLGNLRYTMGTVYLFLVVFLILSQRHFAFWEWNRVQEKFIPLSLE
jgi:amino acid permease